jgi:hypothetical protein
MIDEIDVGRWNNEHKEKDEERQAGNEKSKGEGFHSHPSAVSS